METKNIVILVISAFIVVIVLITFFNREARIKRKIRKTPLKRISNFNNNERAKVIGRIREIDNPLLSPLSNRECVGFHIIVEQEKHNGENTSWNTIIDQTILKDFIVNDNNMNAIVRTKNVKSVIVKDKNFKSGIFNDATFQLESLLKKYGMESEGLFGFNKTLRYKEGILEKGELVAVVGRGTWGKSNELALPLSSIKVLEISSDENEPVYISDHKSTIKKNNGQQFV